MNKQLAQDTSAAIRSLAFYLPQFHPIPENDEWWGPGFTEWSNVVKARKLFPGHYQPHLPADLGFYDLRTRETRAKQAELAKEHELGGFVYYHYWFHGRRVLERPIKQVLESGEPDFPFCFAWANESWTRAWDGGSRHILLNQEYDEEDDLAHIRSLLPAFADPRYVTFDGRPVFLVYRASSLPTPRRTTDLWRSEVMAAGLPEPYLLRIESFPTESGDPLELGFDAAVEFQPRWWDLPSRSLAMRLGYRVAQGRGPFRHRIHAYQATADAAKRRGAATYARWPGVTPMWDNTARRKSDGVILTGSTPQLYAEWLEHACVKSRALSNNLGTKEGLVFVNAWNEWAEGNHLEPDQLNGRGYLDAHRTVMANYTAQR